MAANDASFSEEFLDVAKAQGKPVLQPERVAIDLCQMAIAGVGIHRGVHP